MDNLPLVTIHFHSAVLLVHHCTKQVPEELPPDEGALTEEEFREVLPRSEAYLAEFGAEMAREWEREQ